MAYKAADLDLPPMEDTEILEDNTNVTKGKKTKVKKAKKGHFKITKYNFITGVALLVQQILDKAGFFGKVLGAGLGQIATNHYNAVCSWVSNYVIDNNLFSSPAFLKVFGGNSSFYDNELSNFNRFMSNPAPTMTETMLGGQAVKGVIEQSTIMNIIGTVIQFLIQNPVLILMPTAALGYEVIKRIVVAIKEKIAAKKASKNSESEGLVR